MDFINSLLLQRDNGYPPHNGHIHPRPSVCPISIRLSSLSSIPTLFLLSHFCLIRSLSLFVWILSLRLGTTVIFFLSLSLCLFHCRVCLPSGEAETVVQRSHSWLQKERRSWRSLKAICKSRPDFLCVCLAYRCTHE